VKIQVPPGAWNWRVARIGFVLVFSAATLIHMFFVMGGAVHPIIVLPQIPFVLILVWQWWQLALAMTTRQVIEVTKHQLIVSTHSPLGERRNVMPYCNIRTIELRPKTPPFFDCPLLAAHAIVGPVNRPLPIIDCPEEPEAIFGEFLRPSDAEWLCRAVAVAVADARRRI
jgi:hypothetical protein